MSAERQAPQSRSRDRQPLIGVAGLLLFVVLLNLLPADAMAGSHTDLQTFAERQHAQLESLRTDDDARRLIASMVPALFTARSPLHIGLVRNTAPAEIQEQYRRFVATLASARLASSIRTQAQQQGTEAARDLVTRHTPLLEWITTTPPPPTMTRLLLFLSQLSQLPNDTRTAAPPPQFEQFSMFLDTRYPDVVGTPTSWTEVFHDEGPAALTKRFSTFWEQATLTLLTERSAVAGPKVSQDDYARYYKHTRLIPIFTAHLLSLAIQSHAEVMEQADAIFASLTAWNTSMDAGAATAKLCGTWRWTVHNHQNHGDQHTTISLGAVSQSTPATSATAAAGAYPEPNEIQVHGDAVYLRWNFPNGYQEDSLLLSNRDNRLEGTFKNSLGPYGNISGKRLTSCRASQAR